MASTPISLGQLATVIQCEYRGDADKQIDCIKPIQSALDNALCFVMPNKKVDFSVLKAGVVILHPDDADKFDGHMLITPNPYLAFAKVSGLFDVNSHVPSGIHASAVVSHTASAHPSASIGPNVVIGDNVVIGENVSIGAGTFIGQGTIIGKNSDIRANVTIYHFVQIGERVTIHSGSVIGADGFGFAPTQKGWQKIHQLGAVSIGDNVDIGANTTIDRGALDSTVIESNVIIDNLVHIAHNVHVGEGTAIAGCSAIAGSTRIGKRCIIAGRVSITGHLVIADGVQFHACAVVTQSIDKAGVYASSTLLQDVGQWRKNVLRFAQLDQWVKRIKALEKTLKS